MHVMSYVVPCLVVKTLSIFSVETSAGFGQIMSEYNLHPISHLFSIISDKLYLH